MSREVDNEIVDKVMAKLPSDFVKFIEDLIDQAAEVYLDLKDGL